MKNGFKTTVSKSGPKAKNHDRYPKMEEFGERLTDLMRVHGMTPEMVAKEMRVTVPIVKRWMKLKSCNLQAPNLIGLSRLFRVRASWLCIGEGDPLAWLPTAHNERELLRLFRFMEEKERGMLVDIASLMARKRE